MRRASFFIRGTIILASAVLLELVASNTSLPGQDNDLGEPTVFQAGIGTHESHTDSETAPEIPGVNGTQAQAEFETPPPTRSSFMARWDIVAGATGYLLDVSTSDSFSSYVDGYRDLDVGNVIGRA